MKKNKIIIILLAFLITFFGIYLLSKNVRFNNNKKVVAETENDNLELEEISHFDDDALGLSLNFPEGWFIHKVTSNGNGARQVTFTNHYSINPPWDLDENSGIAIFVSNSVLDTCYSEDDYQPMIDLPMNDKYKNECRIFTKINEFMIDGSTAYVFEQQNVGSSIEGEAKINLYLINTPSGTINLEIFSKNLDLSFEKPEHIISSASLL